MSAALRQAFLIGIDVGTTACETVLASQDGQIAGSEPEGSPAVLPRHGRSEQDPQDRSFHPLLRPGFAALSGSV